MRKSENTCSFSFFFGGGGSLLCSTRVQFRSKTVDGFLFSDSSEMCGRCGMKKATGIGNCIISQHS
jgi:hypothetical protein